MTSGYGDYTKKVFDTSGSLGYALQRAPAIDHFNGTIGTVATTISLTAITVSLLIENTHSTNNILISFDEGSTWKTLGPGDSLSMDTAIEEFDIKGSDADTTYECLAGRV